MNVIINKEKMIDMFDMCGFNELEIIIPLLKNRIERMLQKIIDLIEMYENDPYLKDAIGAINALYEDKKRIEKLCMS